MVAVLTADIINSTGNNRWQELLQSNLKAYGDTPADWNIYRGDSFQIRLYDISQALSLAIFIKAVILQIKGLDVRIAIGIGNETRKTESVTKNTGSAYSNSGRLLENLQNNLEINTPWSEIDEGLNASFNLINTIVEQWTPVMAQYVHTRMKYVDQNQEELAVELKTTQSNVSRVLGRANWQPIAQYLDYFSSYIRTLL